MTNIKSPLKEAMFWKTVVDGFSQFYGINTKKFFKKIGTLQKKWHSTKESEDEEENISYLNTKIKKVIKELEQKKQRTSLKK